MLSQVAEGVLVHRAILRTNAVAGRAGPGRCGAHRPLPSTPLARLAGSGVTSAGPCLLRDHAAVSLRNDRGLGRQVRGLGAGFELARGGRLGAMHSRADRSAPRPELGGHDLDPVERRSSSRGAPAHREWGRAGARRRPRCRRRSRRGPVRRSRSRWRCRCRGSGRPRRVRPPRASRRRAPRHGRLGGLGAAGSGDPIGASEGLEAAAVAAGARGPSGSIVWWPISPASRRGPGGPGRRSR